MHSFVLPPHKDTRLLVGNKLFNIYLPVVAALSPSFAGCSSMYSFTGSSYARNNIENYKRYACKSHATK